MFTNLFYLQTYIAQLIDTHSHIYSEEFDTDRDDMIQRAKNIGIEKILLPNIDKKSLQRMLDTENRYSNYCFSAIGIHPTSINRNYDEELKLVHSELKRRKYIAIGEIGIDLYWDKTFLKEQIRAFQTQIEWALEYNLPIIIHQREAFEETMKTLLPYKNKGLRGVFHSFGGTVDEARKIIDFGGFVMGINGVVTFKNSKLSETLQYFSLEHFILETDAPYLTPIPFRGKRNESSYLKYIGDKMSEIFQTNFSEIDKITTNTAEKLFFK
ncbi:MAG: TatD family hydrolase [Paludibacteraceae bacterium]